jgi:hypothetical protein
MSKRASLRHFATHSDGTLNSAEFQDRQAFHRFAEFNGSAGALKGFVRGRDTRPLTDLQFL